MALIDLTAQLKLKEGKNENTFLFFKADFSIFCIEEFLEQKGEISGINSFLVSVYFFQRQRHTECISAKSLIWLNASKSDELTGVKFLSRFQSYFLMLSNKMLPSP